LFRRLFHQFGQGFPQETGKWICIAPFHGNQFLNDGINSTPQATAVKLAQLGEGDARGASCHPCKANELESVNG